MTTDAKAPPWYMRGEKRVYLSAWRDGLYGNEYRTGTRWPTAYARGYADGEKVRKGREQVDGTL